jgi:DNA-binding transcriptional regulator YdaS (Cro superfamily)
MIWKICRHLGGVTATAQALGVSQPAVSQWLTLGWLPSSRAAQVELLTKGKFTAVELCQHAQKVQARRRAARAKARERLIAREQRAANSARAQRERVRAAKADALATYGTLP